MKTVEFSQRAILLAGILFLAGFVSLVFTELSREYIGIIFICIPVCLMAQVANFEKRGSLWVFLVWGLTFAIYNLDTNLYIAKFIGAEPLINHSGWMHLLGVLLTGFISLFISMIIIGIFNPKLMETEPYTKEKPAKI